MLIDDWRKAYRYLSVQANGVGMALAGTYAAMYDQLKDTFPPKLMAIVTGVVFLSGIILRIVAQKPRSKK